MKRLFVYLALMVGAMTANAASVVKVTSPVNVLSGGSAILPVEMDNDDDDIALFELYFRVPAGFTLSDIQRGSRLVSTWSLACNDLGDGVFQITGYEPDFKAITGTEGVIFTLTLTEDGSNALGTYDATVNDQKDATGLYPSMLVKMPSNTAVLQTVQSFNIVITDRIVFDETSATLPVPLDGSITDNVNVTVKRTLKANEWSTIVLPFPMTAQKAKAAFGDDVKFAQFNYWTAEGYDFDNEDFTPEGLTINFSTRSMTPNVPAGTPYLIKVSSDVNQFNVDAVKLYSGNVKTVSKDESNETGLSGNFVGTFVQTVVPAYGLFISGNKFYYSKGSSEGKGETVIKGFRGWFQFPIKLNEATDFGVKFYIDGEQTAINGINATIDDSKVYTVDGKYIGKDVDLKNMPKGVYIKGGKKIINK